MVRKRVPLENFIKEYSVRNKNNENIPVYSVTNSHGFCTEYFGKDIASKDKSTYKIVPRGYFAYNPSRINVGSVDWQRVEDKVIVSPLYNVFSVSAELDCQYLYYFLRSEYGRQMIKAKASGSVRDNLKLEMLKEMTIPDISIVEQRRHASILDKVMSQIQLRQQQLQKFDNLIKARFVELFGDPILNDKNLSVEKMKNRYFLKAGITTSADMIHDYVEGEFEVPCFGGNGIRGFVKEKSFEGEYPIIGRQGALCGNVQYASGDFHATEHAIIVTLQERDNTIWVYYMLKLMNLYRYHTGAAQPGLAVKTLNEVDVIVADIDLQNQFADFVRAIDKSKVA